jgi:PAS domain S-box-containing protein
MNTGYFAAAEVDPKDHLATGEAERRFREMFDALPAAVYTTDAHGRITRFNPACVTLFGRTPELGTDPWCGSWKLFYPDGRPMPHDQCPMAQTLRQERPIRGLEAIAERPDGSRVWFEPYPTPLFDEAGKLTGAINMLVDITERKQTEQALRESEARLRLLTEAAPVLISYVDAQGRYQFVNKGYEVWFGVSARESQGKHLREVLGEQAFAKIKPHVDAVLAGKQVQYESELPYALGGTRFIHANYVPDIQANGRVAGFFALVTDITASKRAEAARAYLAAIVENSDDAIISKDLNSTITSWNKAAERLFGYTAEEAIGKSVTMLMPPDRVDEEPGILERLRRGESIDHYETVRRHKDGRRLDIEITVSPIRDSSGRVIGASKSARDISERKRMEQALRESEERFRAVADNIPQMAWMAKPDGHIYWYNRRWYQYTGTNLESQEGRGWKSVHHPDHVESVSASWSAALQAGEAWEDTFPLRGKDGKFRWFLSRAFPIRDQGNVVRWFGTNTDIDDQVRAENSLRQADRRKDEFLAMLAHELRNPLAAVRNAVSILMQAPGDPQVAGPACEILDRQVEHMVRQVDDLLDVSRISRGKIELCLEQVELAPLMRHAALAVRPQCQNLGHELTIAVPPEPIFVNADPVRLGQVVGNLLSNACKFTDQGGRIALSVSREGSLAVIRVRDSGVGIAPDQLGRVFEMFVQVDTTLERSRDGLGLGLTLVKRLVEMHDGTVEVHSAGLGQGSEFVVRLPTLAEPVVAPRESTVAKRDESPARRVLVVDDNRDAAKGLAMLLKQMGHQIEIAHDGLEAVEKAAQFDADVILLDIGMPQLNGYEAARRIREQQPDSGVMLVALTGWGQDDDRRKSEEAGFNAHLVKPVNIEALIKLLSESGARR